MGRAVLISLLLVLPLLGCGSREAAPSGPDPQLTERLARGVNLAHAFTASADGPPAWNVGAQDYALIRGLGLRHVRSLIELGLIIDPGSEDGLNAAAVTELHRAIDDANRAGLMFVLALQLDDASKQRLAVDSIARQRLATLWQVLAKALAAIPPDDLVFELLNEPTVEDAASVQSLMAQLVAAVREIAPQRTLVVAGPHFADAQDLLKLQPLADPNLIYSFHFYEPHNFTHQGANWGWPMWRQLHNLPYPSSPEAVAPVLDTLTPEARPHAEFYGQERWNRDRLAAPITQVADWARRHRLKLWCSEFGVYRYYVNEQFRAAWLRDARELFEARDIAWTHWDYTDGFGLSRGEPGARVADPEIVSALGLRP
ncbi:MAG: cellulase family glycosylhydrolase [Pseudomonadota bacterium]|nr:cellulase family glycosylhydrolase [Pseudomonadota bacterium]